MADRDQLIAELSAIVGSAHVITDPTSLTVYECDGATQFKALPDVVVLPTTTQEVSAVVKLANRHNVPFIARGTGTGLSGGMLAVNGGIIIALNRMNRILDIDLANQRAVVEPGVVNLLLTQAVQDDGYYYAPDPSSQQACSIGGNIAENSGGPHTLKYGVTSNHVLGLEMVTTDGEIIEFGGSVEETPGYDIRGVIIGSEGTFGIITKAIVRLLRKPQGYQTLLGIFETIDEASNAVSSIISAGIIPAALEMMDGPVIKAVEEAFHWGFPLDAGAVLIVELDGITAGMQSQVEQITEIFNDHNCREIRYAKDDADRQKIWKSRKSAFGALGRLAPNYITQDGVVPRTQLPKVLRRIAEISEKYNIPIANVFHAGDGNIHPIVLFDERDPDQCERVDAVNTEILTVCAEVGGTITGEHGIGLEKMDYMPLIFSPEDLALMVDIKEIFNPSGLCNPGKIFPTAKSYAKLGLETPNHSLPGK
ncbi:MAG: FAD-binding protein [Candidatus Poribacteria bacterium]|nr:FAD-binding protein [Candidatus Poribacteria bacterium]